MKIIVKVKTKAKEERVEKIGEGVFSVWVKEAAEKGKANAAVVRALAKHFKTQQSNVKIIAGAVSHQKIISISK